MRPLYPHHIWSVDFVQDRLFRGRRYKMLSVIDEYTRQCMTVQAQLQLTSQDVLETWSECFVRYGKPKYLRSDNGPECIAKSLKDWLARQSIGTHSIDPGSPWQNAYGESFNSLFRTTSLDRWAFVNRTGIFGGSES